MEMLQCGTLSLNGGVRHLFRRIITREHNLRLEEMMVMIRITRRHVGPHLHYSICETLGTEMTEK
jgi:hypothetical protein